MNSNFPLKFKKFDIIIIAISIISAIAFIISIFAINGSFNSNHRYVNIYHQNQKLDQYTIDLNTLIENKTITLSKEEYPKLIDDFIIELDPKKGVRVKEVDCYDYTCLNQGWVNIINLPIVCIPNDVRIELTANLKNSGDDVIGGAYYEKIIL